MSRSERVTLGREAADDLREAHSLLGAKSSVEAGAAATAFTVGWWGRVARHGGWAGRREGGRKVEVVRVVLSDRAVTGIDEVKAAIFDAVAIQWRLSPSYGDCPLPQCLLKGSGREPRGLGVHQRDGTSRMEMKRYNSATWPMDIGCLHGSPSGGANQNT